jgi:TP901 family phage tail tape measure protein
MSSPGGGGINLPPLIQQIHIRTGQGGQASAQFNGITQAVNNASNAVGGMTGSWGGMYGAINRTIPTWRATGDALRMTGSLLKYQVAMPLIAVGKASIMASMEFETSMKKIQGLVGITGKDVAEMSSKVLDMAGAVGKAPQELADALYYITSAGIKDTSAAMDILNVSARAASAGLGTTKDVADLATSVMNAYAPGLYNATVATDALVAAVREGKADAEDFAPAMGKVIPVAAAFGVKFQDVAGAVAALTRQGAPAGTAAIQLRQVLGSLLNPTQKATEELAKYGMSAGKLRETIQQEGLLAGLTQLKGAFGDNASALTQVFGNIRPLQAVMALIGPSAAQNAQIFGVLNDSAGDAADAFEVMSHSLGFQLQQASAEGKVALIKIGDALAPVIKIFADFGQMAAKALGSLAEVPGLVKTVATIGGAAIAMVTLTSSFASFIRMRAYTTTALRGIAVGMRDQATGMVTNITTGTSYATTMGIATTSTAGLGTAATGAAAGMLPLAGTTGELVAYIAELMAVMTENSIVTAENTLMMRNLTVAQGGAVTSTTAVTEAVLAGDTAMATYINSNLTAAGAVSALTGAEVAEAVAVDASTVATGVATGANIGMFQSVMLNVRAAMAAIATNNGLTASTTMLGLVGQLTSMTFARLGATIKGYAITARATMASMMSSMLPMMAMMAVAWAAFKIFKWATKTKEINDANSAINGLSDSLSNFRVAPLIVGVDIQYTINGGAADAAGGKNDSAISKFLNYIYPKEEDGTLTDKGKIIQDEIKGLSDDITKGIINGTDALSIAAGYVQKFGADISTRSAATEFFANEFNVDKAALLSVLKKTETDAGLLFKNNFARFSDQIDNWRSSGADPNGIWYKLGATNIKSYFEGVASEQGNQKAKGGFNPELAASTVGQDISAAPGLIEPLSGALDTAGGSSLQFVSGLQEIYNAAYEATKSTKFAELAVNKYAKAAFEAKDIDVEGNTVTEMLISGKKNLNSQMTDLTVILEAEAKSAGAANYTNEKMFKTFGKLSIVTQGAKRDIQAVADVVQSLKDAFDGGLNDFVKDAATVMDAYTEALKNAKRGQDALFGSQLTLIDSQANYGTAVGTALTDIAAANGNISGGSAESLKAQQSLGKVFTAASEVANAIYANTEGDATQKQKAATDAANEYIDAANNAIMKKGGISKEALDSFWNVRLGKKLTTGGETIGANAEMLGMTFGQGDAISPSTTADATTAGKDTTLGIATGQTEGKAEAVWAADDVGNGIIGAYKNKFGIKSPSTVMRDQVGKPIIQGIVSGFKLGQIELNAAASKSALATKTSFVTSFRAFEGFNPGKALVPTVAPGTADPVTTGIGADDILAGQIAAASKEKDRKAALAKAVKLQGKKVSTGIYDIMATNTKGQDAVKIAKIGGKTLKNWAEGVLEAKQAVKTPVANLIKEVLSEVSEKLGKISAVIDAKLNLESAKTDLKKFLVMNTTEMLQASVNAATRAKNQAANKFGGNQGTDVTKYEKSQIKTAAAAAQQAARDYRLGKISYSDYQDAQDALVNTQASAAEASSEVASTTNDLTDSLAAQETVGLRAAAAGLAVITAQDALTTAYTNAKIGGQELKDLLGSLATDVLGPLTSTTLPGFSAAVVKSFTDIVNKAPASMGLSPAITGLIEPAQKETANTQITNTPTSPLAVADQMSRTVAKADFLADVNKRLKTKYKTVTAYINDKNSVAREALWNKYVKDNNVAAKAKGGSLSPGRLTLVGESGPELITPNSAARITPYSVLEQYARTASHDSQNGSQGSGNPINITVNNPVPERASDSIARRMQNMSSLGLFG